MGRTASSIFEGGRDEDHLALVSFTFSPVVDAFFAKGPRVIALEAVPGRVVSLVRNRVPFSGVSLAWSNKVLSPWR
jgi:hypothetical protein